MIGERMMVEVFRCLNAMVGTGSFSMVCRRSLNLPRPRALVSAITFALRGCGESLEKQILPLRSRKNLMFYSLVLASVLAMVVVTCRVLVRRLGVTRGDRKSLWQLLFPRIRLTGG